MASSSQTSQLNYVVVVLLSLILRYERVEIATVPDLASSYPVAYFSPPFPALQIKNDVFVSFRGTDIRKGFLSHLIMAFSQKQIVAFIDEKMEKGDELPQALLEAIERSFISLVIFSQDYASSHWCLEELEKMVECRKRHGQIVIPVFYNVDPSDVRHQKGAYENVFSAHEKKYGMIKVQIWRSALKESANLIGFHASMFGNEAELLEGIVKSVSIRLKSMHQVDSKGLVGIGRPIEHLESLLNQEPGDIRVVGIWGMGGIGKTTIAEELFNRMSSEFEGFCFLANVREQSERHGMLSLKYKLFTTLLKEEDIKIDTINGLPHYVEKRIGRIKVLIVLDDVNDSEQLEILIGRHDLFGSGSRIIITTRDKQVLAKKAHDIYEVEALCFDKALQLFNLNAFKQNHQAMQFYDDELSKRVINYAKGIPLVLKVLGHLLYGKDKAIWESQLEKLKKMPSKKVYDVMRLSYDDLDREEQNLFLDIACFFKGLSMNVDYIKNLLKDGDYSRVAELERLRDKALITISKMKIVSMHDMIQEMALEIVRQESIHPGNHVRLWDPDVIYQILRQNKGTEAIRSINVNVSVLKEVQLSPRVFAKMNNLQFLDFHGGSYDSFGACGYVIESYNYPLNLHLPQGLEYLPNELRYLRWTGYRLKSLPEKFSAENLVILDLKYSYVEKLWDGVQNLENLKVVKVQFSFHLMELPDFSMAINLEALILPGCIKLKSVHPSVFFLQKLEVLDLSWCFGLTSLPSNIHLSSLRYLSLHGCFNIREFSVTSENMIVLDLSSTSIKELSPSILLQSKLEKLSLAYSCIESLPASIKHLRRLKHLDLYGCEALQTLPELPPSIEILIADNCTSLQTVQFPSTVAEQLEENKKVVMFLNCLKLDDRSLRAIELNAHINMMKLAYQHVVALECGNFKDNDAKAMYVYPGKEVPEWMAYRTTEDYITIDLSSAPPYSSHLGFIFSFIVPHVPLKGHASFGIHVGEDDEDAGKFMVTHLERRSNDFTSDHVCLVYDTRLTRYINGKAKNQPRFKIKVMATSVLGPSQVEPVPFKGFGVHPIYASQCNDFFDQLVLRDSNPNISVSLNKWPLTLGVGS